MPLKNMSSRQSLVKLYTVHLNADIEKIRFGEPYKPDAHTRVVMHPNVPRVHLQSEMPPDVHLHPLHLVSGEIYSAMSCFDNSLKR